MTTCELVCVNKTHEPILLPNGEAVVIGRSPQTQITDARCSRNQLELKADCKRKEVQVKQVGSNPSAVDNTELEKGKTVKIKPGDIVYVLVGSYPHIVKFKTADKISVKDKKRTSSSDSVKVSSVQNGSRKRTSTGESEQDTKKRKLSKDEQNKVSSLKKSESHDSDEEHIKSVAEKLQMLKQSKPDKSESDSKPKQKVSSKVSNTSSKDVQPALESSWSQHDKLYIYTGKGVKSSDKIASFDIDGTIITTQSGKVFATHNGDWKIMLPETFGKLKKLHAAGFKIVFFTNQMGIQRGKVKIDELKQKFTYIVEKLGVPVQIFIASGSGIFRKPSTGMWKYMVKKHNDGIRVNMTDSFYCGDAAGRPDKWTQGRKKDFSCSDRLFALNVGLKFYTPEEYFRDHKAAPFKLPEFDPKKLSSTSEVVSPAGSPIASSTKEVVVLTGFPASGKSFFAKAHLVPKGYVHINRDTLGSWQKCVTQCHKALAEEKSVVIDNTNLDVESRARYVDCAKKDSVPCRCFVFTTNIQHIRHNERYREMTDKSHKPINEMVLNSFKSKYKEPNKEEGFSEILKINFVPKFESSASEDLYKQFLLEK
ncbi:bifunctional polynucleotide phosphatase/kinase-like [Haliotis cracherodii]|uniref:bifunctional polynucleotide phosphatase/kinase-like n=1 Tax=Haliotis cracherodii TaxID=6455 RepID=UPI0039E82FBC